MRCNLCNALVPAQQSPHWRKDGYEIFSCQSCGLLFRGDLPTGDQLRSIYARTYFVREREGGSEGYDDYLADAREHRLTARWRLAKLGSLSSPGRLLEVGSAAGFFLHEAREVGWEVKGIDVSVEMAAWGRDQLDLDIASGLFQDREYTAESFDVVAMWDYIEHSIDPLADIGKAAEVLRPGGLLALSTGDAASVVARLSGRRWHLLTPRHHNFFFTTKTLCSLLDIKGFEVLSIERPGSHYSVRYVVHKMGMIAPRSRVMRRLADWVAARPFGERSIRLNLGDIITVIARRKVI